MLYFSFLDFDVEERSVKVNSSDKDSSRQCGGQETTEGKLSFKSSSLLNLKLVNRGKHRLNRETMCKNEEKCGCSEEKGGSCEEKSTSCQEKMKKPKLNTKMTHTLLDLNKRHIQKKMKRCTACTRCLDFDPSCSCEECARARSRRRRLVENTPRKKLQYYTLCEIRRHRTAGSVWLIKGRYVYDVTNMVPAHPGGEYSILRHAGAQKLDCTEDFNFHSRKGQKIWDRYKIGIVVPCPSDGTPPKCEVSTCSIM